MRKDSIYILSVTALLTAAILGGGYYMAKKTQERALDTNPGGWQELKPNSNTATGNATNRPGVSEGSFQGRTDTPIKCIDPELGEFWTNASTCEGADLHNRMSIAQPMPTTPARDQFEGRNYKTPQEEAGNSRSNPIPNLRLHAKSPPPGLNVSCKFAVGKALEIERSLSAAKDPEESVWREDYCEWLGEVRSEQCEVPRNYFYYGNLCPMGF